MYPNQHLYPHSTARPSSKTFTYRRDNTSFQQLSSRCWFRLWFRFCFTAVHELQPRPGRGEQLAQLAKRSKPMLHHRMQIQAPSPNYTLHQHHAFITSNKRSLYYQWRTSSNSHQQIDLPSSVRPHNHHLPDNHRLQPTVRAQPDTDNLIFNDITQRGHARASTRSHLNKHHPATTPSNVLP